jgi:hypothetical protein
MPGIEIDALQNQSPIYISTLYLPIKKYFNINQRKGIIIFA